MTIIIEKGKVYSDNNVIVLDNDGGKIPLSYKDGICLRDKVLISAEAIKQICKNSYITFSTNQGFFYPKRTKYTEIQLSAYEKRDEIAKRMVEYRFDIVIKNCNYEHILCEEGRQMQKVYSSFFGHDFVRIPKGESWTNKMIDAGNFYLYNTIFKKVCSMGFIPNFGFLHRSADLAFIYDVADFYKVGVVIENVSKIKSGPKASFGTVISSVKDSIIKNKILDRVQSDLEKILS